MPEHGGNILEAVRRYGIELAEWVDLSTGINPVAYPLPSLPSQAWQQLPQDDDGLSQVACHYYNAPQLLPTAGSQQAIQLLPTLRGPARVGVLAPSYNEHRYRWQLAGHQVIDVTANEIDEQIDTLDVLLVVNPNNPTGHCFSTQQLLEWHRILQQRGGWLVVDEAYMDCTPAQSVAAWSAQPGLIVLRSIGKFFGLPGLRCGFVLAEPRLLSALKQQLGPWAVSGPGREITRQALQDTGWHQQMRTFLPQASQRLANLLGKHGLTVEGRTALFVWFRSNTADELHRHLARRGIWSRYFAAVADGKPSLRLGLPGTETQWQRLEQALLDAVNDKQEVVCR